MTEWKESLKGVKYRWVERKEGGKYMEVRDADDKPVCMVDEEAIASELTDYCELLDDMFDEGDE